MEIGDLSELLFLSSLYDEIKSVFLHSLAVKPSLYLELKCTTVRLPQSVCLATHVCQLKRTLFHGRSRTACLYCCVWSGITGR